ncbi:hypothetical protein ACOZ4N_15915 [Halorientalis pallida]|uniref:hypothetical protein n=1 Tax=Halorientalis pallida TaxID=2479928 RepID=UPI003C6F3194
MSILRIFNPAPVIRDHYGTLWYDSQHPLGYMLILIGVPLLLAVIVGQFLTVTLGIVGFLTAFFGAVLALSARSWFNIPSIGDDDGERKSAALNQLRRSAMYAVLLGLVSFGVSALIAAGHFITRQNPSLITEIQSAVSQQILSLAMTAASTVLIFLFLHYLLTLGVVLRWLYLMSEAGSL